MTDVDRGRLAMFVGVLVGLALVVIALSRFTGVSMIALAPLYMFTPMLAVLAVCLRQDVPLSTVGLRVGRPGWLVVGALVAFPLIGIALVLAVGTPGVGFDPTVDPVPGISLPPGPFGIAVLFGLIIGLGATVNAVFAFGEEFGWRGYLLWELAPLGFWRASLAIGTIWGLWHAPMIVEGYNYPSFPLLGVGVMTVATIAYSPLYAYLVIRAESVLAAVLLHGVFNGSAGLVIAYAVADDPVLAELVASPVGAVGIVTFGLAAVAIAAAGAPGLTREFAAGDAASSPSEER